MKAFCFFVLSCTCRLAARESFKCCEMGNRERLAAVKTRDRAHNERSVCIANSQNLLLCLAHHFRATDPHETLRNKEHDKHGLKYSRRELLREGSGDEGEQGRSRLTKL